MSEDKDKADAQQSEVNVSMVGALARVAAPADALSIWNKVWDRFESDQGGITWASSLLKALQELVWVAEAG